MIPPVHWWYSFGVDSKLVQRGEAFARKMIQGKRRGLKVKGISTRKRGSVERQNQGMTK